MKVQRGRVIFLKITQSMTNLGLEAGKRGLPSFSITSLVSLNWAWSDLSSPIFCLNLLLLRRQHVQTTGPWPMQPQSWYSSWWKLGSLIPSPMEICLELEKNWTREFGVARGEVTLLSLRCHRLEVSWIHSYLLFYHLLFILITFIINVLKKGLPPSIPVPTFILSYLHPA